MIDYHLNSQVYLFCYYTALNLKSSVFYLDQYSQLRNVSEASDTLSFFKWGVRGDVSTQPLLEESLPQDTHCGALNYSH